MLVLAFLGIAAQPHSAVAADAMQVAVDAMQVKVMTFNIRRDGDEAEAYNHWDQRREMVAEVIRQFAGDFVGIQEAKPNQLADLNDRLPDYRSIALSREADPTRGEAAPIYYRHIRWAMDPEQHGTFWLSDTPEIPGSKTWGNEFYPRIVTWARFTEQPSGRAVYVFNTHFGGGDEAQQKSVLLLASRVARLPKSDPVIVSGDFNATEDSIPINILRGQTANAPIPLIDTFRAANPDAKDVRTAHEFHGDVHGEKIDYIFVRPGTQVLSAEIVRTHQGGRYPSDHYPLTAEVAFSPDTGSF
jgi:endonuclease/exonuclease/phosphatase family metal-dependent hydrolase